MNRIKRCWSAALVLVGVASLLGCQIFNPKYPQSQATGQLTSAPPSISFGNVTIGASQIQAGNLTNTGQSSITVTGVVVSGAGYSISGVSEPLTLAVGKSASFSVLFAPKNAGSADGNIAVSTENGTANITLSGTGVRPPDLTSSPSSFSFGTELVGNASMQTETVKNTGGADLTVTAATVSGTGFSYTGLTLPLTLAPNQASTFGVRFAPTTAGTSSGNLSLTTSGSTPTVDIALSGAGATPATLTAVPTNLTFTNVQVGQSSTQTETVTNMGGSNAQISQIGAGGTGLSVSGNTTPVTLTPGQSTSFSVTFAPQSAGSFSGNVSVTSDASNPNLSVPLTGSAVGVTQSTLTVSNPISVGSVVDGLSGSQTGTLTATGANVLVSSVSVSGTNPTEFSISGLSFPVTVTTTQPISFIVTFTPGATGAAAATIQFASNASNSPNAATLTGTGVSPPVHTVDLSWTASASSDVVGYNVYRAVYTSACGAYAKINSALAASPMYTDTSVADGQTYCYATTAVDSSAVESGYSNIAQAGIPPP
jgi:hypothetical protein